MLEALPKLGPLKRQQIHCKLCCCLITLCEDLIVIRRGRDQCLIVSKKLLKWKKYLDFNFFCPIGLTAIRPLCIKQLARIVSRRILALLCSLATTMSNFRDNEMLKIHSHSHFGSIKWHHISFTHSNGPSYRRISGAIEATYHQYGLTKDCFVGF